MLRRRRQEPPAVAPVDPVATVDPGALDRRWADPVARALAARRGFLDLAARAPDGPVAERVRALGDRLDDGVLAAWATARRADAAEAALRALGPAAAGEQLKAARRRRAGLPAGADPGEAARLDAEVAVLAERFAALNRLWDDVDRAEERLAAIDLRLEAVVATAAGLLLGPSGADAGADRAVADLEAVTVELAALDAALAELPGP